MTFSYRYVFINHSIVAQVSYNVKRWFRTGCASYFCAATLSNEPRRHEGTKNNQFECFDLDTGVFCFCHEFSRKHQKA